MQSSDRFGLIGQFEVAILVESLHRDWLLNCSPLRRRSPVDLADFINVASLR